MSDYKKYFIRQLGLKKSQSSPVILENLFPGIDPDEYKEKNSEQEKMLSPTVISPPVLSVGVRGSSTGGLPSGKDQMGDISPTKVGGYNRAEPQNLNQITFDKTPLNPEIEKDSTPVNPMPKIEQGVTHPHQIQLTAHEKPQLATGASTDSDDTLTLKSNKPKGIDVDVDETKVSSEEERVANKRISMLPATSLSESFKLYKDLMKKSMGKRKQTDECNTCGCKKPNDMHGFHKRPTKEDSAEEKDVLADEEESLLKEGKHKENCQCGFCKNKGKFGKNKLKDKNIKNKTENKEEKNQVEKSKSLDEKYSSPFQRMRSLAGIGDKILMSNGLFKDKENLS